MELFLVVDLMIPVMDVWVRYEGGGGRLNPWADTADTVGEEEMAEVESTAVWVDLVQRGNEGVLVELVEYIRMGVLVDLTRTETFVSILFLSFHFLILKS